MFIDQLKFKPNENECVSTNYIQNGYFYIMEYNASSLTAMKNGFDNMPLIYCIGPDTASINAFWGVNFHLFKSDIQYLIITQMHKQYHMFLEDQRVLLDGTQLNDIYSNIGIGLRCYNRKNVMDCSRIKMQYVPKYLGLEDKFRIMQRQDVDTSFDLAGGNKGF